MSIDWTRKRTAAAIADEKLADAKAALIDEVKAEGLSRIQAVLPGIKDFDTLMLVAELWKSLEASATSPTPAFQEAIDVFNAGEQAITAVNGFNTMDEVNNADPVNDPNWP